MNKFKKLRWVERITSLLIMFCLGFITGVSWPNSSMLIICWLVMAVAAGTKAWAIHNAERPAGG
ncbi:MAG: hypothetical protein ABSH16_00890 [Sedimentisphaerales bacterium]